MMRALPPAFRRRVDLLVVGASAGGIEALFTLFEGLRPPVHASIVIVLHLPEEHESRLAALFARRVALPVTEAQAGEPLAPGHLYFAPPGYHLLVKEDRTLALSCDPPVLYSRPSIDVLMESCADVFGPAAAGFVLTGANEDGARGLAAIHAAGGLTAVQDPADATTRYMPEAAIAAHEPDFILPLAGLQALLHAVIR